MKSAPPPARSQARACAAICSRRAVSGAGPSKQGRCPWAFQRHWAPFHRRPLRWPRTLIYWQLSHTTYLPPPPTLTAVTVGPQGQHHQIATQDAAASLSAVLPPRGRPPTDPAYASCTTGASSPRTALGSFCCPYPVMPWKLPLPSCTAHAPNDLGPGTQPTTLQHRGIAGTIPVHWPCGPISRRTSARSQIGRQPCSL
jgi:hypothetical protein